MTPLLETGTSIDDLYGCRFVSNGEKVAWAPQGGEGEDSGFTHKQIATKYNLEESFDGVVPVVKAAGWIETINDGQKIVFKNHTTSCRLAGTLNDQEKALKEVHQLAKQILGEDKVADYPLK